MLMNDVEVPESPGGIALATAADLQDHLMTANNDLERLQRLLADATETLMGHFYGASEQLRVLADGEGATLDRDALARAMQTLGGAVTALQFQDMASQLIHHTFKRLRNCADRLANETFGSEDDDGVTVVEDAPMRPNPVTQDEMDAGSIELF